MPDFSEKLWTFLGGAGGGVSLIAAGFGYLKWLATRADTRESEQNKRANEELDGTRRRADALGDEMYERWDASQKSCDRWKNEYFKLYYKGEGKSPELIEQSLQEIPTSNAAPPNTSGV